MLLVQCPSERFSEVVEPESSSSVPMSFILPVRCVILAIESPG